MAGKVTVQAVATVGITTLPRCQLDVVPTVGDPEPHEVTVGARVAGAATAHLLARFGLQVLLVDRGRYGSDTLSTHAFMRAGVVHQAMGYHPDVDLMRKAGIRCDDETLAPELSMETFETNVPNLFIAGGAIAGKKTGNIFIENGRFHGQKIVSVLAERFRD